MKIPGGYILQPRAFDSSEAARMPPSSRELFLYIVRNVNHKDKGKYKRGQGFFNIGDIQDALCWYVGYRKNTYSKSQIAKALRRLCEGNMTATTKATRGIIITVCNYDLYQTPKNYEGHDEGPTKETRRKLGGHTKNKNEEELKNEIKEYIPFCEDFFEKMKTKHPTLVREVDQKKIIKSAEEIEKIVRIDKYDFHSVVKPAIYWAMENEFWSDKILSLAGLRTKSKNGEMKFYNLISSKEREKGSSNIHVDYDPEYEAARQKLISQGLL